MPLINKVIRYYKSTKVSSTQANTLALEGKVVSEIFSYWILEDELDVGLLMTGSNLFIVFLRSLDSCFVRKDF